MRYFLLFFSLFFFFLPSFHAQTYPKVFEQLATPLFSQKEDFKGLSQLRCFEKDHRLFSDYDEEVQALLKRGHELDKSQDKQQIKAYLKDLRQLQQLHDKIEKQYKRLLYRSVYENNTSLFDALVKTPLPFISSDARLKEKVVSFYQEYKQEKNPFLDDLSKDLKLDEASYAFADKMFKLHQKNQKVERRSHLDDFVPDETRSKLIQMVSVKTATGYDLYVENHSFGDVSIKLEAKVLKNMSTSSPLPFVGNFLARSRSYVVSLDVIDKEQAFAFQTFYTSLPGRVINSFDRSYVYALPFRRGSSFRLTQGFHGKQTHKGRSAYALDFQMDIGTPVHAMRDGVVVATESKFSEHGFSMKYADKANYIIIQHSDGTMAMYGHLNTNGVAVKLGQEVKKHQKIGYSGNTGYSSGPHLHVHISAIRSFDTGPSSVPFIFSAKSGRIKEPVRKTFYTAR